jgi:hypothetical protein
MRTAILVAACFLASSALAVEQTEKNAGTHVKAKPATIAKAPAQPAKTEGSGRVWTLEMSCCEPQ